MEHIATLQNVVNGEFVIPFWEVAFFAAVITLYAFFGKRMSCLINAFAFTFYWGFMFMLPKGFTSDPLGRVYLGVYLVSGVALYAAVTLSDLRLPRSVLALFLARKHHARPWHWKFSYDKGRG